MIASICLCQKDKCEKTEQELFKRSKQEVERFGKPGGPEGAKESQRTMLEQGDLSGGQEALQITAVCRCLVTRAQSKVAAGRVLKYLIFGCPQQDI